MCLFEAKCSMVFQPLMLSEVIAADYQVQHSQGQCGAVQQIYCDHANDPIESSASGAIQAGSPFPRKLFHMLQILHQEGLTHIASWQPHGRCFLVHNPTAFAEQLPKFFKLSKITSFQRQLNLYGFTRLSRGMDKGAYYNEYFLRGRSDLLKNIIRISIKGNGVRGRPNPGEEPDFWSMEWVGTTTSTSSDCCALQKSKSDSKLSRHPEGAVIWGRSFNIIEQTNDLCHLLEFEAKDEDTPVINQSIPKVDDLSAEFLSR